MRPKPQTSAAGVRAADALSVALVLLLGAWPSCGGSSDSGERDAKPPDLLAPMWPTGASIRVIETGRTYVRLGWTAAVDDVGVARYPIGGDVLGDHYATSPSALISGLAPGQLYAFEIWAADAAGNVSAYPLTVRAGTSDGCVSTRPVVPARITR